MKFHILNSGDSSVGINSFSCEVVIPNTVGADDQDWTEWCKQFLHELYSSDTKSSILTEEEYQSLVKSWEAESVEDFELYMAYINEKAGEEI